MKFHYYVITKAGEDDGNLSNKWIYIEGRNRYIDCPFRGKPMSYKTCQFVYAKAFEEGEIIIADRYGREVCYPGRKPSKWNIEYEVFTCLRKAVERSKQVFEHSLGLDRCFTKKRKTTRSSK